MDLFGFLAAFETCPFLGFDYNYYFICRHIDIIGIRPVFFFFFWWVGNKLINEFSLLCLSFKNQDCVYGLLIKIKFLIFFSDKKLNGYCKCTSSIVFLYPLYARCPSV